MTMMPKIQLMYMYKAAVNGETVCYTTLKPSSMGYAKLTGRDTALIGIIKNIIKK